MTGEITLLKDNYDAVKGALGKSSTFLDVTSDAAKLRRGTHKSYSTVSSVSADKFWYGTGAKTDRSRYEFVVGAQLAGKADDLVEVLRTAHLWLGFDEVPSATAAVERSRDPEEIVRKLNDAYGLDWVVLNRANAGPDGELRDVLEGLKVRAVKKVQVKGTVRAVEELGQLADLKKVYVRVGGGDVMMKNLVASTGVKSVEKKKKKDAKVSMVYMTKVDSNVACSVRSSSPSPKQKKSQKRASSPKGRAASRVSLSSREEEDLMPVVEVVDEDGNFVAFTNLEGDEEISLPRSRVRVVRTEVQGEEEEEELVEASLE